MDEWIGNAVGKMHINGISNIELADTLDVSPQYISEILNGKKTPKGIKERVENAVDKIILQKTKS